jgi:hypothetical protein
LSKSRPLLFSISCLPSCPFGICKQQEVFLKIVSNYKLKWTCPSLCPLATIFMSLTASSKLW